MGGLAFCPVAHRAVLLGIAAQATAIIVVIFWFRKLQEKKMAYQSLILGILFSIGIFAVKSGAGISYFVAGRKKKSSKVSAFLLFALTYFFVFAAAAIVLDRIDPVRHLAAIRTFIQSGMILHLVMAGMLMAWGVMLLKQSTGPRLKSKGWLMLAVPCPVCVTVIFFSAGFLMTCFPDTPKSIVLTLYLAFVLVNLVTMGVIALYRKRNAMIPESFLGGAMLLIAVYFFLSVTIMPQFADMEKIYRLALYQGERHSQEGLCSIPFSILAAAAFVGGFGFKSKKIRNIP
jgi:predicted transporter